MSIDYELARGRMDDRLREAAEYRRAAAAREARKDGAVPRRHRWRRSRPHRVRPRWAHVR